MKSSSTMELRQKLLASGVNTSTYERTMQLAGKVGNETKINQLFLMREQYCLLVTAHGSLLSVHTFMILTIKEEL